MPAKPATPSLLLTFDIEDWFQVENFKAWIPYRSWENQESRVVRSTHRILDLLDTVKLTTASSCDDAQVLGDRMASSVKATFFVLGWIAERYPALVAEIQARGHEIASHGYGHKMANQMRSEALVKDLRRSKECLEDIIGEEVLGYRAPSFSISDAVLKQIQKTGYRYDSSFNDFAYHGRYGDCHACRKAIRRNGSVINIAADFYEIPISNFSWKGVTVPWGGGGYFRLMPFLLYREGIKRILASTNSYVMYLHPWEFDPEQPRLPQASWAYRFRHRVNLKKTLSRLQKLIETFSSSEFISCRQFIEQTNPVMKK